MAIPLADATTGEVRFRQLEELVLAGRGRSPELPVLVGLSWRGKSTGVTERETHRWSKPGELKKFCTEP